MWQSFSNGLFIAAGLIMAIGAQNAFVLAQSLRRQHHLLVATLCVVCDALLVAAGVFGLAKIISQNPILLCMSRYGGAAFLIYYGALALRRALRPQTLEQVTVAPSSRKKIILSTLAVTLLNPHVYLDTVLLIGSLGSQQLSPAAYALGASCASLLWFFSLALGAARLAPFLAKPITWRAIDVAVTGVMWSLAWQLISAGELIPMPAV